MASKIKMSKAKASKPRGQQRAQRDSFFSIHVKQSKAAFSALWQRPLGNILTLAVISMALALPASLYLLTKNIASVAVNVASPSQINLYIQEGTPEPRIMVLKDLIESRREVATVEYISPQQGLAELSQYAGFDQAISLLDEYALPAVLVISPSVDDNQLIKQLAQTLRQEENVTDVRLDEDWLARLDAIRHLAIIVVVSLSLLMFSSVFLIVGNTLRFNVQANKDEIQTMKLIGATDSYILRPYLYSGMWLGLLGSLSAWLMTALITVVLNGAVAELAALYDSRFRLIGLNWDESLLLLMLGTFLGCIAAHLSAKRHLKEIEPV
ncbi:permease-like cell division protein FtsX [Vibrio cincinnatiensis]|uniref:permease-like cell division protein FtsX n=1 Tax=Vibrio cincinnatiensis TaxID=675 RepID=UPI001EE0536B|nr:permease-like cell division protein FtsX [Vibrio cincinnatiensis]MCG3730340.1 cell division protein FtsX [Vibrio cincinnatiensis]